MAQAAFTMSEQASPGVSSSLRLRQGSSAQATWILEDSPGGTMVTIGADPTCDWQIRAAFVPPCALSVLLIGGVTYVKPGPDMGVLMNGQPIPPAWSEVEDGARIDVGLARLEITTDQAHAQPSYVHAQRSRPYGYGQAPGESAASEPVFEPIRELDSGTYPVFEESDGVPAVLDDDERTDRRSMWRYALAGVATACAYGGWIVLLDFL
jgi:hypothetical protein